MSDLSRHDVDHDTDDALERSGSVAYQSDWYDRDHGYTETKSFFRTSEFWFVILGVVAVLMAAYLDGDDSITREDGWRYATAMGVAYAISRGLAKAGTKEPTDTRAGRP